MKSTLVGTHHETKVTLPPSFDPLQCLSMLKAGIPLQKVLPSPPPDEFEMLPPLKLVEEKEAKKPGEGWELAVPLLKNMARIMFKPDHPYRTVVGGGSNISTNGTGVLNFVWAVNGIASTSEWSTIDQLFDEFFIHTMTFVYKPLNTMGGGMGTSTATTSGGQPPSITGSTGNIILNAGIQIVSLFSNAASYSSANAMVPNPTMKELHSGAPWKYVWRNNVRFDPRGISISGATTEAWQGWTLISGASNHGGSVQIRSMSDVLFGDGAHSNVLGHFTVKWDVSFRARS